MNFKRKYEKTKNAPLSNILFVILWIAGHVGSWMTAILINRLLTSMSIYIQSELLLGLLMALGTGVPIAILQMLLLERGRNRAMRGWLPVSVLGWFLSGLAFYFVWMYPGEIALWLTQIGLRGYATLTQLRFVPLFVPVAIVQWVWLRGNVKNAWLWIVAAITGALLFALPNTWVFTSSSYETWVLLSYAFTALAALMYSGATGAIMLYLQGQPHEKAKMELAQTDDQSAQLARLSADTLTDDASSEQNISSAFTGEKPLTQTL